jgi:hypothetical protein
MRSQASSYSVRCLPGRQDHVAELGSQLFSRIILIDERTTSTGGP